MLIRLRHAKKGHVKTTAIYEVELRGISFHEPADSSF
jgi:hypothetical protein